MQHYALFRLKRGDLGGVSATPRGAAMVYFFVVWHKNSRLDGATILHPRLI